MSALGDDDHELETACSDCGTGLVIDFSCAAAVACNTCGSKATDDTPLTSQLTILASGGKRPWAKYRNVKNNKGIITGKKPTGKYCGICRNTFNALGLDEVHGTICVYYKFLILPANAHHSRTFLSRVAEWIQSHNLDDTESGRLKGAKELTKKYTSLTTEKVEDQGWEAPDWDFVAKDKWDTAKDGVFDTSKVTTRVIFGQSLEGIWVLRGREGVFKWKHTDKIANRQSTLEDDGTGPFAEERLQNKLDVIRSGVQKFETHRAQHYVDKSADALDIQSILALLPAGCEANGTIREKANGDPSNAAEPPAKPIAVAISDDESSDEEQKRPRKTLGSLFAASAKPPKTSSGSAAPSGSAPARKNGKTMPTPSPSQKKTAQPLQGENQPSGHESAVMDGRSKRIMESLCKETDSVESTLKSTTFDEDLQTGGDKQKKADLTARLKQKSRNLVKTETTINGMLARIRQSKNEAVLKDVKDRLLALLQKATYMSTFLSAVTSPAVEPEPFFEARSALEKDLVTIGPSYFEFDLTLHARQAMMRSETKTLVKLCMQDSPEMARLKSMRIGSEKLVKLAGGLILDSTLEVAGKLVAADVQEPISTSSTKKIIVQLFADVEASYDVTGFLAPPSLRNDIQVFGAFLDPQGVPVEVLGKSLETVEELKAKATTASLGPMIQFLCEGSVGLKMIAHAETVHTNRQGEVAQERN